MIQVEIKSQQLLVHPAQPVSVSAASPKGVSLCASSLGRRYAVVAVHGDDALAHRLVASGLWSGAQLERIGQAPFGDPLLFRVHGYRLALRASEAERVQVVEVGS